MRSQTLGLPRMESYANRLELVTTGEWLLIGKLDWHLYLKETQWSLSHSL